MLQLQFTTVFKHDMEYHLIFFKDAFLITCFTFSCELSLLKLNQVSPSLPPKSKNTVKHFTSVVLSEMNLYLILPHSELLIKSGY